MEFQFDEIGLAAAVERVMPRSLAQTEVEPRVALWTRGWRFIRRQCMGYERWCRIQQRAQLANGLAKILEVVNHSSKPTLLYVVPYDVVMMQTGGGKRIVGIAKALADQFQVLILSLASVSRSFSVREVSADVWMVALPESPEFSDQVKALKVSCGDAASLMAFAEHFNRLPAWDVVLEGVSSKAKIWATSSPMAWPLIQRSFNPQRQTLVYDAHDELLDFLKNGLHCADPEVQNRAVDLEKEMLAHTWASAFCTEADRKLTAARCSVDLGKLLVIPNGVDVDACQCVPPAEVRDIRTSVGLDRPVVIFVGAHHRPNYEAVNEIVRDLSPAFPNVIFVVVGMYLAPYREFSGIRPAENVVFTGPVSEETKEALFSFSEIALAPMKTGTGSSLKIPEYLAHGKIVLGTPVGLRGFETSTRFHSVVVTSDLREALARTLRELKKNSQSFSAPCREARAWVQSTLDWSVAVRPLRDVLRHVAEEVP